MKWRRKSALVVLAVIALANGACSVVSSTAKRSGLVALGGAGGALAGAALSDQDPVITGAGAVAGAGLTHLALGEDAAVKQAGFDQGYIQGQSDSIKRQYFLRQALEQQPLERDGQQGEPVYYVVPGPEVTVDGRRLAPHQVVVRVVE